MRHTRYAHNIILDFVILNIFGVDAVYKAYKFYHIQANT
jgi:hypothetical protein